MACPSSLLSLTTSLAVPFFFVFLSSFCFSAGALSVTSDLSVGALPAPDPPPQPVFAACAGTASDTPATSPAILRPATMPLIPSLPMLSPPLLSKGITTVMNDNDEGRFDNKCSCHKEYYFFHKQIRSQTAR